MLGRFPSPVFTNILSAVPMKEKPKVTTGLPAQWETAREIWSGARPPVESFRASQSLSRQQRNALCSPFRLPLVWISGKWRVFTRKFVSGALCIVWS